MKNRLLLAALLAGLLLNARGAETNVTLFEDGFADLRTGSLGSEVGAHAEYHYLPETGPKGNWYISAFASGAPSQRAWRVARHNDQPVLLQVFENKQAHTRPMVVGGDDLWQDCTVAVQFAPDRPVGRTGVVFRYRNDRCHYFFGVEGAKVVLKMVQHEMAFRKPYEVVLASQDFAWKSGDDMLAEVTVAGQRIEAKLNGKIILTATDTNYPQGKIGLVSDQPARFSSVKVTATAAEKTRVAQGRAAIVAEEKKLQAGNPKAVLWKKFRTDGFGVSRNVRFGDLDGDGQMDFLFGQVRHHGPKDANSEVSCLTAVNLKGEKLWQVGDQDPWKDHLSNDVAFQIHDLDGDGLAEVIYATGMELIVADGKTGKTKYKVATPELPANTPAPRNRFPRVLGDALFFCDFRGLGRDADIVLKDRYNSFWVFNDKLELQWQAQCNTGHYPYAYDVDGDGKDELFIGYSMFNHEGKKVWSRDDTVGDHVDGVAMVQRSADPKAEPLLMWAASDEGMLFVDPRGKILKHHRLGHVQNPVVGDFRTDLPGLETVSINFWGNQGIVHYYDADGNIFYEFEPCQHGSMCLPVNWTGQPPEFWILSPNVEEGGMFDGHGRKVFEFPADGHPDMCMAVMDLTGDCRDEIVVWDPYEMWIYTQSDSPKAGRLYKPKRNPLWNYSNYQATVSLPGWSDDKPDTHGKK